jgi:hypothetical protein
MTDEEKVTEDMKELLFEFAEEIAEVIIEIKRADGLHGERFHSTKEWWGVMKEEFDELWDEIKNTKAEQTQTFRMRKEAIQCIAMLLKGMRGFIKGDKI